MVVDAFETLAMFWSWYIIFAVSPWHRQRLSLSYTSLISIKVVLNFFRFWGSFQINRFQMQFYASNQTYFVEARSQYQQQTQISWIKKLPRSIYMHWFCWCNSPANTQARKEPKRIHALNFNQLSFPMELPPIYMD
jgi:hypothetical protein